MPTFLSRKVRLRFLTGAVFEGYDTVEGIRILAVSAEVTGTNELKLLLRLSVNKGVFDESVFKSNDGLGVQIVVVGLILGNIAGVLNGKQISPARTRSSLKATSTPFAVILITLFTTISPVVYTPDAALVK